MADIYTISAQKILNIPRRRRKSNIEHHGGLDDVGNDFEVLKWVPFYHTIKLHNHPVRLKPISSDRAHEKHTRHFGVGLFWSVNQVETLT